MGGNEMNVLPIEKQFEIMDLIYQKLPYHEIATRANVPKSTVQNYKKRGPPVYRKYAKNPPGNPSLITEQEELKVARQQFQEILFLNSKLIIETNTANTNANYLQKVNAWKDTEKDMQLNYQYRKFDESVSIAKDLKVTNEKLIAEGKQKDDKIKNIQDELEQYKSDLVKASESLAYSTDKIGTLTRERNEFKDKAESLERKHESDWMLYLTVAV
jgi:hypothetical protein